jgi:hypothetical protein
LETKIHLIAIDGTGKNGTHDAPIMAQWDFVVRVRREDEWVWGWDPSSARKAFIGISSLARTKVTSPSVVQGYQATPSANAQADLQRI